MSFLNDFQIKEKINSINMISNYIDLNIQLQSNSFELTIDEIQTIHGTAIIDFDNSSRYIPKSSKLDFHSNFIKLNQGIYKILFNEIINLPNNIFAFGFPRSSLIRSGSFIETAIWDSGYIGKSECLLIVNNKEGLIFKKNARVIQLIFYKLKKSVKKKYSGIYMYENLFDSNNK